MLRGENPGILSGIEEEFHRTPIPNGILNLRDRIGCANEIVDNSLQRISAYLHAVTDVACRLAGHAESARYLNLDANVPQEQRAERTKVLTRARAQGTVSYVLAFG